MTKASDGLVIRVHGCPFMVKMSVLRLEAAHGLTKSVLSTSVYLETGRG